MMNVAFLKSYETLKDVYVNRAFSSISLNKTLNSCSNRDKSLITKIVYGVLDNDIKLNYIISKFVRKKPQSDALIFLKIGAYCLAELSIPAYAVVNDVAELSKISGDRYTVGFVNATLKRISQTIKTFDDYPTDFAEGLSIRYSYPQWAVGKLIKDYGKDTAKKIVSFPPDQRNVARFNPPLDRQAVMQKYGCEAQSTPFNDAFYVSAIGNEDNGGFTYQSLSSMAIARICAEKLPEKGRFLDCCSAPGGKAVYVKQLRPDSSVTACDVHLHRVKLIQSYAARMHTDIDAMHIDMTEYSPDFDGKFDVVLCDVPCSGFGALENRPDIKLFRKSEDLPQLMSLQYSLLSNCSNYVKKGGYIVYSTCTLFDNENGQNIRKFLKENPNFGYGKIALSEFPFADGNGYCQFLPYRDGVQGFFVAVLKRNK